MDQSNPCGLLGIDFVEFVSPQPERLDELFRAFGFSKLRRHTSMDVDYFRQGDIHLLLNREDRSFASDFAEAHGPSLCSMGWRVENAQHAFDEAVRRGAKPYTGDKGTVNAPAIYGIGDSLIYFVESFGEGGLLESATEEHAAPVLVKGKGFTVIDHLTNNVYKGTMAQWSDFYKNVFGFTEVRYFDIRGVKTGLTSYALRSPDGSFCIPINEGTEAKSQINEYLDEYNGPGVQHLAFATDDLLSTLETMDSGVIDTLDIDDEYYEEVFQRVPNVTEDPERVKRLQVLIDGDDEGYLLQIFTRNLIGPIFIEMIQRKNHLAFGEGNFGALFRSIERDQERRGYL